jgi:hypothetical protein
MDRETSAEHTDATTRVTVLRSKFVRGDDAEGAKVTSLSTVLTRPWKCGVLFQQGFSEAGTRLTIAGLENAPALMTCVALDLDPPAHQVTEGWRLGTRENAAKLLTELSGFFFETPRGARLVFAIEPIELRDRNDAREWSSRYDAFCDGMLGRRIICDRACSDPFHLFYATRATRDPSRGPEDPFTLGDPATLQPITLPKAPTPNNTPGQHERKRVLEAGHNELHAAHGALFEELRKAGLLRRSGPEPGSYVIVCPRNHLHVRPERAGDGATIYYAPSWWGGSGIVFCHHEVCRKIKNARQWRREIAKLEGVERVQARPSAAECVVGISEISASPVTRMRAFEGPDDPRAVREIGVSEQQPRAAQ